MPESFELLGTIVKLEGGFAFAKTDLGNVYIPIHAARNKNETLNSLKEKFSYRENVIITVHEQKGKNDCKLVATKVRKMKKNNKSQESETSYQVEEEEFIPSEVHGPILAMITSSTDSFAFAHNDGDYKTIFVPGEAFDKNVVKRVDAYAKLGSQVLLHVKRQKETNGCKWIATNAVKHFKTEVEEARNAVVEDMIVSFGQVIEVLPNQVEVWDADQHVVVICPQLTYIGGLRGRRAKNLTDLISTDEKVMYKAVLSADKTYEAVEWKHIEDVESMEAIRRKIPTSDGYAQTPPCYLTLIVKTLFRENKEYLERFRTMLPSLPDVVLPDEYLNERDKGKFDD